MAAIARANPEAIRRLVSGPNGDGTFNVTIYSDTGGAFKHRVGRRRSSRSRRASRAARRSRLRRTRRLRPSQGGPELWVMLIEKAYATVEGGYGDIDGGYGRKAMTR